MTCYNIYFLRHLKTKNNELQIISGQTDSDIICKDYPLLVQQTFDKIYCSPSPRCVKTLDVLVKDAKGVIYDNRLVERYMGELENLTRKEAAEKYPNLFMNEKFDLFKMPPNGENYEDFKSRIEEFYNECIRSDEKILVCSHNQTLKMLRLIVLKK